MESKSVKLTETEGRSAVTRVWGGGGFGDMLVQGYNISVTQ